MRRLRNLALVTATVLILAYTAVYAMRPGYAWMAVAIGGMSLVASWILILLFLRPR